MFYTGEQDSGSNTDNLAPIDSSQTEKSGRVDDNEEVEDGKYSKKYVNWYVGNVEKDKQHYVIKNEQLTILLNVEKEKNEVLEQKVAALMESLNTEKEKAMDREKTMKELIQQLEGKRQKMKQFCIRCEAKSQFKFQSLSFCSKICLEETAKSLKTIKTSLK